MNVLTEVRRLRADWDKAYKAVRESTHPSEVLYHQEQRTWDRLVDYVEANDLNYTEHDPRGAYGSLYGEGND